jgi:hypothetical protein
MLDRHTTGTAIASKESVELVTPGALANLDDLLQLVPKRAGNGGPAVHSAAAKFLTFIGSTPHETPIHLLETEQERFVGLPWLLLRYPHLDWGWLTSEVKLRNRQNRLGFVVALAKQLAERMPEYCEASSYLSPVEEELEDARLAKLDTLCHESWSERRREQVNHRRSGLAEHWNLSTGVSVEQLAHYGA